MNERRLDVLDGLRGIAVLLVLWYHVWEINWLPAPFATLQFIPETGFVGVHLFFFLSGFVISYPFIRAQFFKTAPPTWGSFAWRRCIKIVPSYVLSIAAAFAIGYAATQSTGHTFKDVVTHLLFVHTWFPQSYGSINGVLWTLAVEVEFYLVFPIVWWCFARSPLVTAAAMIGAAIAWRHFAFACCYPATFEQIEENLPGYLDIFAFGMLSAVVYTRYSSVIRSVVSANLASIIAVGGFCMLATLLVNLYSYRMYVLWSAAWQMDNRTWLGVAFAIVAISSLVAAPWWRVILANSAFKFLAVISYNLYLYHQIVARELFWHHLPPYGPRPHDERLWQITYAIDAFAASIAVATLVTYAFERPLLRIRDPASLLTRLRALSRAWRPGSAEPP